MTINKQTSYSNLLVRLLAKPWLMCFLMAILGTLGAWLALQGGEVVNWNRILVGTVFGFSVGIIYVFEMKNVGTKLLKRTFGGVVGLMGGGSIAFLLDFSIGAMALSAAVGMVLGATAKDWIWHISLP